MNFQQFTQDQLFVIAGPCVIESKELCLNIAEELKSISKKLQIPIVFKASFKKANRTSHQSFKGIGDIKAIEILAEVKMRTQLPILTDIHETNDIELVQEIVDIIQIPAFLCRQTELIQSAANTGKIINIKKGQFASAENMRHAIEKVKSTGNHQVLLTERGTFFGYSDLVVDMRNIPKMKELGVPVIYDATHSVQQPGMKGDQSGGDKNMISPLLFSAIAAGADGLFIETHPEPEKGLSDASTMLALDKLEDLLQKAQAIFRLTREF